MIQLVQRRSVLHFVAGVLAAVLCLSPARSQTAAYDEPFRPQVHFSPAEHWTNDPNGLVYFHGEYHLFYQYNPFGDQWGHMSWGHAVSTDLLHWKELPVAIPEQHGVMIFTGSVVVDRKNSSGLCAAGTECLVAVYTGFSNAAEGPRQNQNLAYSRDNGRTWLQYSGNPVLDLHLADFRDPSVSWDAKQSHWLMAVSLAKQHKVRLYASPNLKDWTQLSEFGPTGDVAGDWECPDLLHIPADKPGDQEMWALKVGLNPGALQGGSGEQYFLGSFDGQKFTQSTQPGSHGWTNYGKDDYCAISFNGLPKAERPVLIGWMSNWQYAAKLPTAPWRGQMSLPRRLSLVSDRAGVALRQEPVIEPLRSEERSISLSVNTSAGDNALTMDQVPYELDLAFDRSAGQAAGIRLYSDAQHWTEIGFDPGRHEFYLDRTRSGASISPGFPARTAAPLIDGRLYDLRLIVDRSSLEAYAQQGTIAMTDLLYPPSPANRIELFSGGMKPVSVTGKSWKLRSVWR